MQQEYAFGRSLTINARARAVLVRPAVGPQSPLINGAFNDNYTREERTKVYLENAHERFTVIAHISSRSWSWLPLTQKCFQIPTKLVGSLGSRRGRHNKADHWQPRKISGVLPPLCRAW